MNKSKNTNLRISISPRFSNNQLQSYVLSILETGGITDAEMKTPLDISESINTIHIQNGESKTILIIYQQQDLINEVSELLILERFESLFKHTKNILIILLDCEENKTFQSIKFFLEVCYSAKFFTCCNNSELVDLLVNITDQLPDKEAKANTTAYDDRGVSKLKTFFNEEFKDEITPVWIKHLMCIPGISEIKAHAIAMKYTFKELMEVYTSDKISLSEKENYLKGLIVENKETKSSKNLGVALSKRIFKVLTSNDPDEIIN